MENTIGNNHLTQVTMVKWIVINVLVWMKLGSEGGFMSKHCDNIHHSHGQQYGYPQVTALLYLNDNYEGGTFKVADKTIYPERGSAVIFPSNFMFPHEAKVVTKGTRWSVVTWLM